MPPITKNLGFIKAIHEGTSAPSNVKMLWYDTSVGINFIKYYDTIFSIWKPLASNNQKNVIKITNVTNIGNNFSSSSGISTWEYNALYLFTPSDQPDGATTLKEGSLPIIDIVKVDASVPEPIEDMDLNPNNIYVLAWDGSSLIVTNIGGSSSGASKKYHTDNTTKMTILASESTSSDDHSLFYDLQITAADRGKYFDLNVASVGNLEYGDGLAYNIILPLIADCDDGFCFKIHFNTRGGNTSEVPLADVTAQNTITTNKYMSSGKTYTWTLSKVNNQWFVDEEESLSSPQVTYLPTYSGEGGDHLLSNTNHTYLFDAGYPSNNTLSPIKDFVLLPVAWCLDKWEELVLITDLPDDLTKCPKIYVFDSLNEIIVGEGTSWQFPAGSKAGSKITFKAIKTNKWFIKDQMILI